MSDAVAFEGVSKWFGDVVAVSEVSFHLGPGVTALLGPNGAGKSTVLRMLCGLTPPSRGDVRVLGGDPRRDPSVRGRLGLVPQQESVVEPYTGLEFVTLAATLSGVAAPRAQAGQALEDVGLDPGLARPLKAYSRGMRQRVKVAAALVHDPEVVVADEPLTGLDPRQRRELVELFRRLGDEGRCVVVSSHVLDEVERFGSRVLVVAQGRLAAEGDFRDIRALMDDRPHRVRVRCSAPLRLGAGLLEAGAAMGVRLEDGALVVDTVDVAAFRRAVVLVAAERAVRLQEVRPLDEDLDSVFRYLVGR